MYIEVAVPRPIVRHRPRNAEALTIPEPADQLLPENQALAQDSPVTENPLAVTFHYRLPDHLRDRVQLGQLVEVPFRTERLPVIVIAFHEQAAVDAPRDMIDILDSTPVVSPIQIELARWLSYEYLTPLGLCFKQFLPPGTSLKSDPILKPTQQGRALKSMGHLSGAAQILLTYLQREGSARLAEVDATAARKLLKSGLAQREAILSKPTIGPKTDRMVELLLNTDEVEAVLPSLGRPNKQANLLIHLATSDDPLPDLAEVLAATDCSKPQLKPLLEQGHVEHIPAEIWLTVPPSVQAILAEGQPIESLTRSPVSQQAVRYLVEQAGSTSLEQLQTAISINRQQVNTLVKKGLLTRFDEPARLTLTLPPEALLDTVLDLQRAKPHAAVLRLLAAEDGPVWIGWIYTQTEATLKTLRDLAEADLISINRIRRWRDPLADKVFTLNQPPELTSEQQQVWQAIQEIWQESTVGQPQPQPPKPILLHGVTGSGKTEIYFRAIDAALQRGQQALLLVPEITLATQMVERVSARFPGQVALWHSALSPGERYDSWERVRQGDLSIIVGARSALFAPLQDLGVIILDEEHEAAYKQSDHAPLFHARDMAIELARLSDALLILGSASPEVSSYQRAEQGQYHLLRLPSRVLAHSQHWAVQQALVRREKRARQQAGQEKSVSHPTAHAASLPMPTVHVIDLREELKAGNRTMFSRALQEAMQTTLSRGEQLILFLNRRGTSTFINCRDCGYVQRCSECETTLTYHADTDLLICHYCGHRQLPHDICPTCHSRRIRYFGLGTQRVEQAVKEMFPAARPIRWDQDTVRRKGSHHVLLQHFLSGEANVLIGTQMIAKGLDLPLVTLVGVISADTSLYIPDFRAAERTFQLLMQVAGRAGRSPLEGTVIIQSYTPDLPVIHAASQHDYLSFYYPDLAFRQQNQYPPFKRLAVLLYSGPGEERATREAAHMVERLQLYIERAGLPKVDLIGPTPHFVRRVRSQYRWFILIRAANPAEVLRPLMPLPHGWRVDIDPMSIS